MCHNVHLFMCDAVRMQALSQEVAHYLGMNLSGIKIKRFADGEIYVQILVCGSSVARCGSAPVRHAAPERVVRAQPFSLCGMACAGVNPRL